MKMKTYRVPCYWTMGGYLEVEAESREEAAKKAVNELPLPEKSTYLEDSFRVDQDGLWEERE